MPGEPTPVKCLVWDLDDTLWQGTLLEGGETRLTDEIRQVVTTLDARGILQSIASRNDFAPAWERLETLGVAEYFVLPRIGWGPKSASVAAIAERLRFAEDTLAFIDDRPAERAEVARALPGVRCYPADQAPRLTGLPEFSPATVTVDSARRRALYRAGFRREAEQAAFTGPDQDFLRSLNLEMTIGRAGPEDLSRVAELTLRTSQMNATGVHYPDTALRALLGDPGHEVLVTTLSDRFGPYGAVGVLLLERHPRVWHLKLLATSCRVVSVGAGTTLLTWLTDQAARSGVHLVADFRPTARNRVMEIAYRFAGFGDAPCACAADLAPAHAPGGVQRLHLLPERRPEPAAVRLTAVDLTLPASCTPE